MVLLDTHALVWLSADRDHFRLSKDARRAIDQARRDGKGLAICDISLLELSTLMGLGRINVSVSFELFLQVVEEKFIILPITIKACAQALHLPPSYPKDPADRIIGATAIVNGIPLITADRAIRESQAVATIW